MRLLRLPAVASVALLFVSAGCATTPVGVKQLDARTVHRNLTANVISAGEPSFPTRNVLFARNLVERFRKEPEKALAELHKFAVAEGDRDTFFALAELSFLHAEDSGDRSYAFAAALYSWAFLFGDGAPDAFDPRLRVAVDLYNRGLTEGLSTPDRKIVDVRGGTFPLPFGELVVSFDSASLEWNGRHLSRFLPVAELEVRGLENRFRSPGIGAPLAAYAGAEDPDHATGIIAPRLRIPATALLRVEHVREQLTSGHVSATLELHSDPHPEWIEIGNRRVPLEREETATIAAMLADAPIWKQELAAFLGSVSTQFDKGRLIALRPHRAGGIPVVFVHGTASNPGRWAEMVNVLDNDERIYARFEPWFFFYNSGSPIIYSSYLLRKALRDAVAEFDPSGSDACLHDMVVVGHSQGGLLTKMTVVDSGDLFFRAVSSRPLDELRLSGADRELVRAITFVEPLPFVKRVVFIATPQRGSFLSSWTSIRRLVGSLVSFPRRVTELTSSLVSLNPSAFTVDAFEGITAVDNMSPSHRFIKNLSQLPIAPGVAAHSIIAVQGDGPIESGDDGVVEYSSAHIDGVESEKVVRSSHSTQANPETIEEVRRILLLHAANGSCGVRASDHAAAVQGAVRLPTTTAAPRP